MKRARIRNATDRVGRRTGGKLTVEQKVLDCVRAREEWSSEMNRRCKARS